MRKKPAVAAIAIFVLASLLCSCEEWCLNDEPDPWSEDSPLYTINYNSRTGKFTSDYDNVVFIEQKNEDFVILNLADIQLSASETSTAKGQEFDRVLQDLITRTNPDLITFTGDFGGYGTNMGGFEYVAAKLDSVGIPWAPVFGNHDCESVMTIMKCNILEDMENCLFKTGPEGLASLYHDGVDIGVSAYGNYVVNVVKKDNSEKGYTLVTSLIMMNTGSHKYYTPSEISDNYGDTPVTACDSYWGCLSEKQIKWYEWAVRSAQNAQSGVTSKLFVHIPIYAYLPATLAAVKDVPNFFQHKNAFRNHLRAITYQQSLGTDVWNTGYEDSFGVMHDSDICCSAYDDFVFEKITELGSTDLVICGHDHTNNTVIKYQGVTLAYSLKTGWGSYHDEAFNGGTTITIEGGSMEVEHVFSVQ